MMNKIKLMLTGIFFAKIEKKFFRYLKSNPVAKSISEKEIVLVEFSQVFSNIIGLYFFLTQVRKNTNATFYSYLIRPQKIWTPLFIFKYKKMYQFLGISKFFYCYPDHSFSEVVEDFYQKNKLGSLDKRQLEELCFGGVWVGDLIYDSYHYKNVAATVELGSEKLELEIKEALYYYFYWRKFFSANNVKKIIVSHTVYTHFSMPMRVAIDMGIEAFQVNDAGLYRLSKERLFGYHEFFDYKKIFHSLPSDVQKEGLNWAKQRLEMRFSGAVGVDMHYSTKSAWTDKETCLLIKPSEKIKIFIALHCFFDSPHCFGLNLFPDFYEWLHFLGKISEKTDYEWYLKTHPDFLPGNIEVIEKFMILYPKFKLLPSNTSHHSIVNSGIDFVLTVYGSVGLEYSYFDVPVINASKNNIHCAFDFNLHPESQEEYEALLSDLKNVKLNIPKEEILQYYFVKNKVCQQSWVWTDPSEMFKQIGGYSGIATNNLLYYFFKVQSSDFEKRALNNARIFLDSKDYSMLMNSDV